MNTITMLPGEKSVIIYYGILHEILLSRKYGAIKPLNLTKKWNATEGSASQYIVQPISKNT